MDLYALVEEWPHESLVSFRELPGCLSTAQTAEEAIQKASEAITDYFLWLKQNKTLLFGGKDHPNQRDRQGTYSCRPGWATFRV